MALSLDEAIALSKDISQGREISQSSLDALTGRSGTVISNGFISTVPEKTNGFLSGLTSVLDIVKTGYGLYNSMVPAKTPASTQVTVPPLVVTKTPVTLSTASQAGATQIPSSDANTIVVQTPTATPTQATAINYMPYILIGGAVIIIAIILGRK